MLRLLLILFFCTSCLTNTVQAHGNLHEQIEELTAQIEEQPENAVLYVQRGLLHRSHGTYMEAVIDLQKALALDETLEIVYIHLSQAYLQKEVADSALLHIDYYLSIDPQNPTALMTKGEAYQQLGNFDLAAVTYEKAVVLKGNKAKVQDYISWANATAMSSPQSALQCLDKGMQQFGPLITLQEFALQIELKNALYDDAINRINAIMQPLQRKETWLVRKAEILEQTQQPQAAQATYREAQKAIQQLKPRLKNTDIVKALSKKIENSLHP